ncbi:MAG: nucleotidyltransferase domain-containing protein [Anaerolineae bacterium]|nr:nucleotidyltransferase domain-containing protein [Anaerolineae bacterium]
MKYRQHLPAEFLSQVIVRIRHTLGDNLVAIVLFGSYAKGTARRASDIDLLVVARQLPRGSQRDALLQDQFDDLVIETGISVMPILLTLTELRREMYRFGPLMFGLVTGYRIVWGKLPLLLKWERFVRANFRWSRKYDAWIIRNPSSLRLKPNLT